MAGEVQLKLQTTLDFAFLQTQLSSLSTLAKKVNFSIQPTLNVAQLKKDLRKVEREFRLQIGDSQVQGAIDRLDTLSRKLAQLEDKKIKISVEPSVNVGDFKKSLKSKLSGLTIEVDVVAGNVKQQASNQGFAAIDAIEKILAQGASGRAFRGPVQQAQENIARKGVLERLEKSSLAKGGYNVPGVQKIITTLGGIPQKGASRAELVEQAKKLVKEADNVANSVFETLKDMQMALKPIRGTGAMPGSFFAARSAGNYQDIISSMAGLTKNPRAAGLMLRQLPEERIRTGLLDKATQQAQYYENVPLARQIQRATRGFDPLLKAISEEFANYTKSLNPTNPWVGKIGDGLRKVTEVASVAAGQKALPPVGGTTSPVNRLIGQLAGAKGGMGGAQASALFAARSNVLPGIRMPGMAGTLPGLEKLANSLALLSNNALKARRSIEEVGFQNLPTAITGLKGAAFDKMLNQAVLQQRGIQPFAGQSAPIFAPTQGPARPSTVTYPLAARGRFDRTGIGAGAGSFIPPLTNAYSFPMSGMMGPFSSLPPRGSMGQFPMAGMMYPSSPLGQINAQTSMFGVNGPFGPGNRPPGGFYRGGGAPGGGGQVPSGGFPSAGPMGPSSQLGGKYFAVGQAINNFQKAYSGARQFLDKNKLPLGGAIAEVASEFGNAVKQVLLFGTAYKALAFFIDLPNQAFKAAKSLATYENQLKAVTATTGTFEQSFAFVDSLAQRFNVPLESARQGFVKLYASMQPAGFNQEQIEGLFTGISKATAAFGLSADKVDRVNYAFAQMASKGQIMSEELKGQLGDVLPGALALFARAAQMSIPEFSKAMEDGAFKGKAMQQVLGNVSILMNRDFGPAAQGAAKTLQGALTQIQNNLKLMYESMSPIVNVFAAAFGPEVNSLIKDVTSVMKVLTATFVDGAKATDTLSPRALALYNTIQQLRPSFESAGAAIADLGSRLASLAPIFVQIIKLALDFIGSPLGRAAIVATIAITSLNAALATLSAIGLTGAIKSVYSFISGLLKIPQATGVARVAVIGLKLAITGIFVGAVLAGLDFVIGKLIEIGTASSKSKEQVRGLSQELDIIASSADVNEASKKYMEANTQLVIARRKNEKALKDLSKARGEVIGGKDLGVEGKMAQGLAQMRLQEAQNLADAAYEEVLAAQKQVQAAKKTRANAIKQQQQQRQQTEQQLQKIDLSAGKGDAKKAAKAAEDARKLADEKRKYEADLMKVNAAQAIALDNVAFENWKNLQDQRFDYLEAGQNEWMKREIKFQRDLQAIEIKRIEAIRQARQETQKAEVEANARAIIAQERLPFKGGAVTSRRRDPDAERTGWDISMPGGMGAPVPAPIDLTITGTGFQGRGAGASGKGYGNWISGEFELGGKKYELLLGHFGQINVSKGMQVPAGTVLGTQGVTGHATGPHVTTHVNPRGGATTQDAWSALEAVTQRWEKGMTGVPASRARKEAKNDYQAQLAVVEALNQKEIEAARIKLANEEAQRAVNIAVREYVASIAPVEQQRLENNLLQDRINLLSSGAFGDALDTQQKIAEVEAKRILGIQQAKAVIEENEALMKANDAAVKAGAKSQSQATSENQIYAASIASNTLKINELNRATKDYIPTLQEKLRLTQQSAEAELKGAIQRATPLGGLGLSAGFIGDAGSRFEDAIGRDASQQEAARFAELQNQLTLLETRNNAIKQSILGIGDAFATAMTAGVASLVDGTSSAQEVFSNFLKTVGQTLLQAAQQMIATYIVIGIARIFAGLGGGGKGGGLNFADMNKYSTEGPISAGMFGVASANGNFLEGGFQAFANGGVVNGPTLGLVGEGNDSEYIIPSAKMSEAMSRYASGIRGAGVIPGNGNVTTGSTPQPSMSLGPIDVRYNVERINSVDYVTADQFQRGMALAAQQGAAQGQRRALAQLQQNTSVRRKLGL